MAEMMGHPSDFRSYRKEAPKDIELSLFDFLLILTWLGSVVYILKLSIFEHMDFSLVGAVFMVTMSAFFIKFFYETFTMFVKWATPHLKKKLTLRTPSFFGIFSKRIEFSVRIVDKDRSKVKF